MLWVNLPVLCTMYNIPMKKKFCYGCGDQGNVMGDSKCYDSLQAGKLHVHV